MHCTITAISESPAKEGLIWVGTDDGNVQVTVDGGQNWTNVTKNIGAPKPLWVSRVEASHFDDKVAYVALDGHRNDDFAPYLYMTTDGGKTWTLIRGNLPAFGPIYVVREDRRNPALLFVGTEFGVFTSLDKGHSWRQLNSGLPTVAVYDMVIHPRDNDLVIGTHGRSIYVLDIAPLQELTPAIFSAKAYLFDVKPALLFQPTNARGWQSQGQQVYVAPNPPFGAVINYYLSEPMTEDVTITVSDARNSFSRQLKGRAYVGIHQVVWDLRRTEGGAPGGRGTSGSTQWPEFAAGLVTPGEYTVTLSAGLVKMTKRVVIEAQEDPSQRGRITTTAEGR
jgi:hypothetical protein